MKRYSLLVAALLAAIPMVRAQEQPDPLAGHDKSTTDHSQHAAMTQPDHSAMNHGADMNDAGKYLMRMASGTGQNPLSWPMPMLMPKIGSWDLMVMGQGFVNGTQQSGPRGGDKVYSANWGMVSAFHKLGSGAIMLQSMFSLEPATVTNRSYPLLLQTGETAYGKPLIDGQHPHDFLMGLGVQYARPLSDNTMLQLYYAPVGDPALGPVAFPHRASALELPQATLSHHFQDSSHIANNVATVAVKYRWLRLEASSFYGTEPNENRWNIDWGPMNSYSARVSVFPSNNWMAQFSAGRLADPERHLHSADGEGHGADIVRMTSSLHYTRPTGHGHAWSTSFIWGQNLNLSNRRRVNSFLVETLLPISQKNFLTGRVEVVDKDELFSNDHTLEHELERTAGSVFRIQAYTAGYTRDMGTFQNIQTGIGANVSSYVIPAAIQPYYGSQPWGVNFFVRFRIKPRS